MAQDRVRIGFWHDGLQRNIILIRTNPVSFQASVFVAECIKCMGGCYVVSRETQKSPPRMWSVDVDRPKKHPCSRLAFFGLLRSFPLLLQLLLLLQSSLRQLLRDGVAAIFEHETHMRSGNMLDTACCKPQRPRQAFFASKSPCPCLMCRKGAHHLRARH